MHDELIKFLAPALKNQSYQKNIEWFQNLFAVQHSNWTNWIKIEFKKIGFWSETLGDKLPLYQMGHVLYYDVGAQIQTLFALKTRDKNTIKLLKQKLIQKKFSFYYQTVTHQSRDLVHWGIDEDALEFLKWFFKKINLSQVGSKKLLDYGLYAFCSGKQKAYELIMKKTLKQVKDKITSRDLYVHLSESKQYHYLNELITLEPEKTFNFIVGSVGLIEELVHCKQLTPKTMQTITQWIYEIKLACELKHGEVKQTLYLLRLLINTDHSKSFMFLWKKFTAVDVEKYGQLAELDEFIKTILVQPVRDKNIAIVISTLQSNRLIMLRHRKNLLLVVLKLFQGNHGYDKSILHRFWQLWHMLPIDDRNDLTGTLLSESHTKLSYPYFFQGAILGMLYSTFDPKTQSFLLETAHQKMVLGLKAYSEFTAEENLYQMTGRELSKKDMHLDEWSFMLFQNLSQYDIHFIDPDKTLHIKWFLKVLGLNDAHKMQRYFHIMKAEDLRSLLLDKSIRRAILLSIKVNDSSAWVFNEVFKQVLANPGQWLMEYLSVCRELPENFDLTLLCFLISKSFYKLVHPIDRIVWLYNFFRESLRYQSPVIKSYIIRLIWINASANEQAILVHLFNSDLADVLDRDFVNKISDSIKKDGNVYQDLIEDAIVFRATLKEIHERKLRSICLKHYNQIASALNGKDKDPSFMSELVRRSLVSVNELSQIYAIITKGIHLKGAGPLSYAIHQAFVAKMHAELQTESSGFFMRLTAVNLLLKRYQAIVKSFNLLDSTPLSKTDAGKQAREYLKEDLLSSVKLSDLDNIDVAGRVNEYVQLEKLLCSIESIKDKYKKKTKERLVAIHALEKLVETTYSYLASPGHTIESNIQHLCEEYQRIYQSVQLHHIKEGGLSFLGSMQPQSDLVKLMSPILIEIEQSFHDKFTTSEKLEHT